MRVRRSWSTTGSTTASVRDTILASWTRSREWDIARRRVELSAFDTESDSPLVRAATAGAGEVTDELAGEPVSVILTDAEGVVLERRTGDSALAQALDRIWLAPGFSYAEKFVGTNGIGTALEGRGPAEVFGHEHYVEPLAEFACAGAPVWHPVSGKLLGVIDLTCWRPEPAASCPRRWPASPARSRRRCWTSRARASSRCCTTTSPPAGAAPRRRVRRQPRPRDDATTAPAS